METQNSPTNKKGRGPIVCRSLTNMREGEKIEITFVDGQPIGDTIATLASYCGVVVRNITYCLYTIQLSMQWEKSQRMWHGHEFW